MVSNSVDYVNNKIISVNLKNGNILFSIDVCSIISSIPIPQTTVPQKLAKLNKLYKTNRIMHGDKLFPI